MKLYAIILGSTLLAGTIINAKKPSPVSYSYENFLWDGNQKLYWPDSSEIHCKCWNDYWHHNNKRPDYNNKNCQTIIHYLGAVQKSVYNQHKREEYQTRLAKNKAELAAINANENDINNNNHPDQSMINAQWASQKKLLLRIIQDDENALAQVPTDIIPIQFPTEGTQEHKDTFKGAIANFLSHSLSEEEKIKEITNIKSLLERARNGNLYERQ